MKMKLESSTINVLFAVSLLANVSLVILHLFCWLGDRDSSRLSLWMTYDEVREVVPHLDDRLLLLTDPEVHGWSKEELRMMPVYHVNLEKEYGLILGFNPKKELVLINDVERADLDYMGSDPVEH